MLFVLILKECYIVLHWFFTIGARHIRSLKVKCDNDVCEWTGELGDLETHLQSCDYALLPCTNECKIDNEIAKFLRKDLEEHLTNDCPRRQYKCPHCQETGEHEERTTTHLETVLCPNDGCGVSNSHCQLPSHRSTCEYECVPCKYGCEERLLRKCLREHEEDTPLHLLALSKTREKRIKTESSNQPKTVTFRMTDFQKYKKNHHQWYSPPFYTSYTGYKMCLSVNAHLLSFRLRCSYVYGDNDDSLSWRFTGTVTVELLNQLEDDNHGKNTEGWLNIPVSSVGLISSHLISDLDYNADKNTQYLKEDTLVFRVSVQVPDYKPWLEPTIWNWNIFLLCL